MTRPGDDKAWRWCHGGGPYWQEAAQAHRVAELGHTQGKLVRIVDEDLAAAMEL
jgi:hypothetical protein